MTRLLRGGILVLVIIGWGAGVGAAQGPEAGLVYSCSLESLQSIAHPEVGPAAQVVGNLRFSPGRTGQGIECSAGYLLLPSRLLNPEAGTIEMWVKLVGPLRQMPVVLRDFEERINLQFDFRRVDGRPHTMHAVRNNMAEQRRAITANIGWEAGEYHHLAFTWDRTQQRQVLYLDFEPHAQAISAAHFVPFGPQFAVGSTTEGQQKCPGLILEDLHIYNYAKTDFPAPEEFPYLYRQIKAERAQRQQRLRQELPAAQGGPRATLHLSMDSLESLEQALPEGSLMAVDAENLVLGRQGQAFRATGTNRIEVEAYQVLNPDEGTIDLWFRPLPGWGVMPVVLRTELGPSLQFDLRSPLQRLAGQRSQARFSARLDLSAPTGWQPEQWHHLVFTWSRRLGEMALYVDGELAQRQPVGERTWSDLGDILSLGNVAGGSQAAQGDLDDLVIYNYAREPLAVAHARLEQQREQDDQLLARLSVAAHLPPVAEFLPQLKRHRTQVRFALAALQRHVDEGTIDQARQRRRSLIEREGRELALQADRLRLYAEVVEAGKISPEIPFLLGVQSSAKKVLLDKPFAGQVEAPIEISAARGEYEPRQLVILPLNQPLREVAVSCSELSGPGGASLSAEQVRINPVGYLPILGLQLWPDPLLYNEPFDVPVPEAQAVWISVHVPPGTPAGDYQGTVTVAPQNAEARSLPLRLHVWDFDLPQFTSLRSCFWLNPTNLRGHIEQEKLWTLEGLQPWLEAVLDSRLCPMLMHDFRFPIYREADGSLSLDFSYVNPLFEYILDQRGANSLGGLGTAGMLPRLASPAVTDRATGEGRRLRFRRGSEEYLEFLRQFVRAYTAHMKAKGWFEKDYLYLIDEPGTVTADMAKACQAIHEAEPNARILCTVPVQEPEKDTLDLWVPLTPAYNREIADRARAAGDEVWWYVCCGPHRPFANLFIRESPSIDARLLPWMNFHYGSTGLLYWGVAVWRGAELERDPGSTHCFFPHMYNFTGDGILLYPGDDPKQPIRSVRLDNLRDGMEDYDYLVMLREGVEALKEQGSGAHAGLIEEASALLAIPPEVITTLTEYTKDPAVLYIHRAKVARMIERIDNLTWSSNIE